MRLIAIETSGRHGSVALLEGSAEEARLIRQLVLTGQERTARTLAPALHQLLTDAGWAARSVGLIAVAVGPGSFTGLRIGVTTAKTLAYATAAEVVGVHTLAALAAQAPPSDTPLWAILDAQRQELFAACFENRECEPLPIDCRTTLVTQDEWLSQLRAGDWVIGPVLRRLAARLPAGVVPVAEELWQPTAAAVGRVGWQAYRAGRRDDLWKLVPLYGRPSYAEEKRKS